MRPKTLALDASRHTMSGAGVIVGPAFMPRGVAARREVGRMGVSTLPRGVTMARLGMLGATGTMVAVAALIATPAVACVSPVQSLRDLHVVVIYEENHSFDNLYGGWGSVGGRRVEGRPAVWKQVDQAGDPIRCL